MLKEFINDYGMAILSTILTAVVSFLGVKLKSYLDKREDKEFINSTVDTVVKAIQQMYADLDGEEKKEKAIENISNILEQKGIYVTELELEMLLESTVLALKKGLDAE